MSMNRVSRRYRARQVVAVWRRQSVQRTTKAISCYLLLIAIGALIVMPISWMLTAALKADQEVVFTLPPSWFPTTSWHVENFYRSFVVPAFPLWRYTLNTVFLTVVNVIGQVVSCSLVAFAFARLRFPAHGVLFTILIATMLIPYPVTLVPQFLLYNAIRWTGSYLPLTVPAFAGSAYLIFLVRQYMRSIPTELDDAARIDGCGYWGIYRRIVLPLASPALVVVAIFTFMDEWNDFMGPLIYLNKPSMYTLAVGLLSFKESVGLEWGNTYKVNWNLMMAATLVSIMPVLVVYFAAQDRLIGGIASVGIKG